MAVSRRYWGELSHGHAIFHRRRNADDRVPTHLDHPELNRGSGGLFIPFSLIVRNNVVIGMIVAEPGEDIDQLEWVRKKAVTGVTIKTRTRLRSHLFGDSSGSRSSPGAAWGSPDDGERMGARQAATHKLAAQSGRRSPSVPAASESGATSQRLRIESHPRVGSPPVGRYPAQHWDHSFRAIPTQPPPPRTPTGQSATTSCQTLCDSLFADAARPTTPPAPSGPSRIDPFLPPEIDDPSDD